MSANEFPENDNQFMEHTLTNVTVEGDRFVLESECGCLSVEKVPGVEPKKGDTCRYYGKGFGYPVRGVYVNGQKLRYQTEEQLDEEHRQNVEKRKQESRDAFERDKAEIDKRVEALPAVFQRRLDRFRAGNPNFRWEFEGYELFSCEQAVVFAEALKTKEALAEFGKLPYEEQMKLVPAMSDGHSGNTFGAALRLAFWFVTNPENVVREHGAMVPLVGCKQYGCTHEPQAQTEEGQ